MYLCVKDKKQDNLKLRDGSFSESWQNLDIFQKGGGVPPAPYFLTWPGILWIFRRYSLVIINIFENIPKKFLQASNPPAPPYRQCQDFANFREKERPLVWITLIMHYDALVNMASVSSCLITLLMLMFFNMGGGGC